MALHGSKQWIQLTAKESKAAIQGLAKARQALAMLNESDLAFFLRLRNPMSHDGGDFEALYNGLKDIETYLVELGNPTKRRRFLRDTILSRIVEYVRRMTGKHNDALLSDILPLVLDDPAFDLQSWMKRRRKPKVEPRDSSLDWLR